MHYTPSCALWNSNQQRGHNQSQTSERSSGSTAACLIHEGRSRRVPPSLLTAHVAVSLACQLPTRLQGATGVRTLHVSHEVVPLSTSPGQRSVVRDLGACKRPARRTTSEWRLYAIALRARYLAMRSPRRMCLAGISLEFVSSPTTCNAPLHQDRAAKSSKISQPLHPLSHVK